MAGEIQPVKAMARPLGPVSPRMPVAAAPTMTPKEIVGILRRHVLLVILCTMMGLMIGGGSWFLLRRFLPKYTAKTGIAVLPPGDQDPLGFNAAQTNKDLYYQFRNTMAGFIKQQNTLQELLNRDKIRETKWFKQFADHRNPIADAVEDLEDNLGVGAQREGEWIMVSMTCGSKKESALIVNEMVDLFLRMQQDLATKNIGGQLAEARGQGRVIKESLDLINSQLDNIREGTEFTNLGQANFRDYLNEKLADVELSINETAKNMGMLSSQIETLRVRAEGDYDEVVREQIERDPTARSMRERVASLKISIASQMTKFGENHRRVREMREALKQAEDDLAKRQSEIAELTRKSNLRNAEDAMTAFTIQLESLQEERNLAKVEYKDLDNLRASYAKVMTIRDERQTQLEKITEYIEKLNALHNDPTLSKVQSVGQAPEPLVISFPKWQIFFPGGFMLGFMVGIGLAFAIELLNDLVRTPSDVMKHLRVPLLGMICHEDEDEGMEDIDLCHVVRQAPYSIISECYRQFKTNLRLSGSGDTHKSFFITSINAGEGKTSVAVNMTSTFVADDKKVLFIDTNFRRPCTATMFPRTETNDAIVEHVDFGLSNYLMGQCEVDDVIRSSSIEGLDIIDSGPLPSSPASLLAGSRMKEILERTRNLYDYVIIDGPPLLISDAKIVASQADGTIVVFNTETTRRGAAQRALRELKEINANLAGTVLLGVKAMKGGYFHEIFKSYRDYQQVQVTQPI